MASRISRFVIPLAVIAGVLSAPLFGQTLAFDVASIHQDKSGLPPAGNQPYSNFPLGPGDVYIPNGGYFKATNLPLMQYILFAYKIQGNQFQYLLDSLPKWVTSDRFDIEARAEGKPTKDQMRQMMQALLADRFKLAIHTETRQLPVYAMVLAKPGVTGPQLRPHAADPPCSTEPSKTDLTQKPPEAPGGFPMLCGGILGMPAKEAGQFRLGARNVSMKLIAEGVGSMGRLGRPVIDESGLTGTFDFSIEFKPDFGNPRPPGADFQADDPGTRFLDALKEQFGLKLESKKGPVEVLVADHIEHPSDN
jgi:uncharacterized protein (TIGR03435 family)